MTIILTTQMKKYTYFFNEIGSSFLNSVGGKGLRLAQLYNQGFAVPSGFCISTRSYEKYIKANRIDLFINSQLSFLKAGKLSKSKVSKNIKEKMLTARMPNELMCSILTAYSQLQKTEGNQVAVRSSAIAEDTDEASFAGQHDTFLCIEGEFALLSSIKKCWASLWSQRVIDYRVKNNFNHHEAAIAVVIQQMVPAEISGVLFTANPVSGNTEEIIINAARGLGEALVSGKANADNVTVNKNSLKIKQYLNGNGSVECLNKKNIISLTKTAKKIEEQVGKPQDIEWAISKDKIYLLQARPVTTLEEGEEEHWTADNAQEACPTVVTPLSAGFAEDYINEWFNQMASLLGSKEKLNCGKSFDGYLYLSVTGFKKLVGKMLPGIDEDLLIKQLLSNGTQGSISIKPNIRLIRFLPVFIGTIYKLVKAPAKFRKNVDESNKKYDELNIDDIKGCSTKEIIEIKRRFLETLNAKDIIWVMYGVFGFVAFYSYFCKLVDQLPKKLNLETSYFFKNSGMLDDAKAKDDFKVLIRSIKTDYKIYNLLTNKSFSEINKKIDSFNESEFYKNLSQFLDKFGYMGDNILELMTPRWIEDRTSIWKMLKAYLASENLSSSSDIPDRGQAVKIVNDYFSSRSKILRFKKWRFNAALKLCDKYIPCRENYRFLMLRIMYINRRIAFEEARILREAGYLKETNDVFFLKNNEIHAALIGQIDKTLVLKNVEIRKKDFRRFKTKKPPRNIYTKGKNVRREYEIVDLNVSNLKGIAACAGCVRGKARVLSSISEADKLRKGDILVTKFTDPSWTPLFGLASAIVVDIGSMLSHGAIIARELGVPAVLGVRYGTEVIKDGQEIIVNGTKGIVYFEKSGDVDKSKLSTCK